MIGDSKEITLDSGIVVCIPKTQTSFRCNKAGCNADLIWATTKKGRSMPVHFVEGKGWICHFADCPGAKRFRRKGKKKLIVKKT